MLVNKPCHRHQGFQPSKCKFLSPGETMTAIWESSATSFQIGLEELGGGERQPSATLAFSQ